MCDEECRELQDAIKSSRRKRELGEYVTEVDDKERGIHHFTIHVEEEFLKTVW